MKVIKKESAKAENKNIIELPEEVSIELNDRTVVLEKGERVEVVGKVEEVFMDTNFQINFESFVQALAELSVKYGVVVKSIGGVSFYDGLSYVEYDDDITSGDLIPIHIKN